MINVLFVAWEFPPLTAGGVQRPLYFVKYLRHFNINPIVITVEDYGSYGKQDKTLLNDIPEGTIIERIKCDIRHPKNKFSEWVDVYLRTVDKHAAWWKPHLNNQLERIINQYRPHSIYVTIPPFSMAPLWVEIARKHKLPLLLDFRDAWSQWVKSAFGSWFHYKAMVRLEKKCINAASKIICTSKQTAEDLKRIHPTLKDEKISLITNGFDGEIKEWVWEKNSFKDKFIIGYVGSFYYYPESRESVFKPWWKKLPHRMIQFSPRIEDWLYRSPYFFFRAVATLLKEHPEFRDRLLVKFAGTKEYWMDDQITKFGLKNNCELVGFLNHDQVVEFQQNCDALLLTSSKVIGGRDYSIAGKTFEYFTMGKPIVGFVCEGAQKDILTPSGISVICDPDNEKQSAQQLKLLLQGKIDLVPDYDYIKSFERRKLTQNLALLFIDLMKQAGNKEIEV